MGIIEAILLTIITAATPLVLASIGELVTERSGVLNLGVEGMMVMGAVLAFAATQATGSPYIGILAGIACGALFSLLFGFLTLTLVANQVATGLALTILGLGVSGMIGEPYRRPVRASSCNPSSFRCCLTFRSSGRLLFKPGPDLLPVDRAGLRRQLVPVQEPRRPQAALDRRQPWLGACARHPGHPHRYLAVMFGGACAGLAGGAALAGLYAAMGGEHDGRARLDRAGAGGLRVLAAAGACSPAVISSARSRSASCMPRRFGIPIPSQFLSALPYAATIVVLVIISHNRRTTLINTPASLGKPFVPDR
jgi:ABC-type uncharacterized transport system permease subunit